MLGQNLIKIENIEIVDMGYYREGAITDYANLFKIKAKMLVRNNSDMKISLIRTKAKFVFRNFKTKQDGEGFLDLDIGTTLPQGAKSNVLQTYGQNMKHLIWKQLKRNSLRSTRDNNTGYI